MLVEHLLTYIIYILVPAHVQLHYRGDILLIKISSASPTLH